MRNQLQYVLAALLLMTGAFDYAYDVAPKPSSLIFFGLYVLETAIERSYGPLRQ